MTVKKHPTTSRSRGIYLLPNLFTVAALFAGFYAVVAAMKGHFDTAAIAIFVALVLDGLDGRVARLTNTQSAFGAQLDSLSDMLSFGLAPALVLYSWSLVNLGKVGWLSAFVYAVAVALRLARFNTQLVRSEKRYFQGLACTPGAGFIAAVVWVGDKYHIDVHSMAWLIALIAVLVGILMISNIRYRSFKDLDFKNHVSFIVIVAVVVIFVLISIDPPEVLFTAFLLYVLSGPVCALWRWLRKRRKLKKNHRGQPHE